MKRGTPDHPKVMEFAEALGVKRPTALGYLELLWHFTARYAPQGNIGKFSDRRIEAALDWSGQSGRLVGALCISTWLQSSGKHRLIVHDWHEHCDESTKKLLHRRGLEFLCSQQVTENMSNNCPDSVPQEQVYVAENNIPSYSHSHSHSHIPVTDNGGQTTAVSGKNGGNGSKAERLSWFSEEFWPVVWSKTAVGAARAAWLKKITGRELAESVIRAAIAQGPGILQRGHRPGCTTLHPATWLNQERWEDQPEGEVHEPPILGADVMDDLAMRPWEPPQI